MSWSAGWCSPPPTYISLSHHFRRQQLQCSPGRQGGEVQQRRVAAQHQDWVRQEQEQDWETDSGIGESPPASPSTPSPPTPRHGHKYQSEQRRD